MRRFNYKEVFEKFFPFYYKEYDSYKNAKGEGLLERFIKVCTEYFDTDVVANPYNPGLDNFINLIDIDQTPDIFLNYLWEYLGEIPYAWGVLTDGKPYTQENLKAWIKSSGSFPRADARRALKYAISLFKIRGTTKFYSLLGRIYGVQFELLEAGTGVDILSDEFIKAYYRKGTGESSEEIYSTYGSDVTPEGVASQYPVSNYQSKEDCLKCVTIKVNVKMDSNLYNSIINSGVPLSNIINAFQKIIEKYLPAFCKIANTDEGNPDVNIVNYTSALLVK